MDNCIFCKLVKKEIPTKVVYEDDDILVFPDLHPIKPIHLLIIPKTHISEFLHLVGDLHEKLFTVVQKMIIEQDLTNKGYRLVVNGGGLQEIDHLHVHLSGPWNS